MEYYSAIKMNEILPFATAWMNTEGIMLSEIRGWQMPYDFTYMQNLENKINKQNRNRLIYTENRLMVVRREGGLGTW